MRSGWAIVVPQRVAAVAGLHLGLGLFVWILAAAGYPALMMHYFKYLGPAYLLSFSFLEYALARRVRRAFQPGEALRNAWTMIMVGAALRVVGIFLAHVVGVSPELRSLGLLISGPMQMACLTVGLAIVLRLYRQLGYSSSLKYYDWLLIAVCLVLAGLGIALNVINPSMGFLTDPMLCVLLLQSVLLRRSVSQMGGGLVAACWTSYIVAVVLTALGDAGIAAMAYSVIPEPWHPITWLIWYPAAAAYALGPAFLSEAVSIATAEEDHRYPAACNSNSSA